MKRTSPSARWLKRWATHFAAHGGHNGPATLSALRPRAVELYRLGGNAAVVGAACAREYRLFSDLQQAKELEGYGKAERAAAETHLFVSAHQSVTACELAGRGTRDIDRVECQACRNWHARHHEELVS